MKSQSDLVQFLIQKLSLRSYQEINQRQGRVASYIQMKRPVLQSWRGARTRAGMYVLHLHEKWFSSLPVYNGLMTKQSLREAWSFENNLANSLPWQANHDLKDQVGSASIPFDRGSFRHSGKRAMLGTYKKPLQSWTGITTCKTCSTFLSCEVNKVQYTKENAP